MFYKCVICIEIIFNLKNYNNIMYENSKTIKKR